MSKLKNDVNGDGTGDSEKDTATGLINPDWRNLLPITYDLLIIGSFGNVSDSQSIQVAHKGVPSDWEGSNQWMTEEIDLIKKTHKKDSHCHIVLVYEDRPGAEKSKNYYLEKIENVFNNCEQDGGKRDISTLH